MMFQRSKLQTQQIQKLWRFSDSTKRYKWKETKYVARYSLETSIGEQVPATTNTWRINVCGIGIICKKPKGDVDRKCQLKFV